MRDRVAWRLGSGSGMGGALLCIFLFSDALIGRGSMVEGTINEAYGLFDFILKVCLLVMLRRQVFPALAEMKHSSRACANSGSCASAPSRLSISRAHPLLSYSPPSWSR